MCFILMHLKTTGAQDFNIRQHGLYREFGWDKYICWSYTFLVFPVPAEGMC